MNACLHTGPFDGDLVCTRDAHDGTSHTYVADWAPDSHTDEVNEAVA